MATVHYELWSFLYWQKDLSPLFFMLKVFDYINELDCFMVNQQFRDKRDDLEAKAAELGYHSEFLMVIDPERFQNGKDGPCHTPEERKRFWTDVCKSLHVSLDTIFAEARKINNSNSAFNNFIPDLEERIESIKRKNI